MRLFKTEDELVLMRRAAEISAEAHRDAARIARDGRFEYELEAELFYVFRGSGGSGPAYGTIVAGGAERHHPALRRATIKCCARAISC